MAELASRKQRKPKRRLMETQVCGAEVRRIHVIYFLSRKGHIEHPHLIRVHHLSRNGVHLRDVKRWLSELRGKEMADAFAWSYKRRYKKGYVWQDLLDEDLITPISDNEYVLKGSEISFSNSSSRDDSLSHKQSPTTKEEISQKEEKEEEAEGPQEKADEPGKAASPEMDRESLSFGSEKSTLTDDLSSTKLEEDNQEHHSHDRFKVEILHKREDDKTEDHSFCASSTATPTPTTTSSSKGNNVNPEEKVSTPDSVSSGRSATFKRSKSYSNGASVLLRNLISCGAADTNDSALVTINKRNKPSQNSSLSKQNHHKGNELILTKGDKFGGSQRVFETSLNRQSQYDSRRSFDGIRSPSKSKTEFNNQKAIPPYKPINGPQCSQCGKPFKPEKLHAHMKSCKGMKAMMAKCSRPAIPSAATFDDKGSERSSEFAFDNDSFSGYYLMREQ